MSAVRWITAAPPQSVFGARRRATIIRGMRVADPGLIGRDEPLARLRAAAEDAARGLPRAVLVTGEAGIGKTRLIDAFVGELRAAGWQAGTGHAVRLEGGSPPYLPFVQVLQDLVDGMEPARLRVTLGPARDELSALLPGRAPARCAARGAASAPGGGRADPLRQARLFEALLDVGERIAADAPVVITIEDIQWADPASADLLRFLVDRARVGRILLLVTARTDEVDAAGRVRRLLTDLARRAGTTWLDLGPLDRPAIAAVVRARTGAPPTGSLVDDIARRSGGNPLLAEGLAAAHMDRADLPTGLREAMRVRLDGLPAETATVVRAASLMPVEIDEARLAAALGIPPDAVSAAVRAAIDARILALRESGRGTEIAFRNEVLRQVVHDTLLPAERRGLHRSIAGAGSDDPGIAALTPAEAAHHWVAAGDRPMAFAAAREAHSVAVRVAAFDEATHWGRVALDLWPTDADPSDHVELLRSAAEAATLTGDAGSAVAWLRQAVAIAGAAPDPSLAFELRGRLRLALFAAGEVDAATADAQAALDALPAEPPSVARAEALAHLAALSLARRDWERARTLGEAAATAADAVGSRARVALAMGVVGLALVELGDEERGLANVRRAWEAAAQEGAHAHDLADRRFIGLLARLGRFGDVVDVVRRERAVAAAHGLARTLGRTLDADEAEALVQLGRWTEATSILDATLAEDPDGDDADRSRVADARLRLRRDGPATAEAAVATTVAASGAGIAADAGPVGPRTAVRRSWLGATEVAAEAAILAGDPARALEILAAALAAAAAVALAPGARRAPMDRAWNRDSRSNRPVSLRSGPSPTAGRPAPVRPRVRCSNGSTPSSHIPSARSGAISRRNGRALRAPRPPTSSPRGRSSRTSASSGSPRASSSSSRSPCASARSSRAARASPRTRAASSTSSSASSRTAPTRPPARPASSSSTRPAPRRCSAAPCPRPGPASPAEGQSRSRLLLRGLSAHLRAGGGARSARARAPPHARRWSPSRGRSPSASSPRSARRAPRSIAPGRRRASERARLRAPPSTLARAHVRPRRDRSRGRGSAARPRSSGRSRVARRRRSAHT